MWWTVLARAQEPVEPQMIVLPTGPNEIICRVDAVVRSDGSFGLNEIRGCPAAAKDQLRADLATWTWAQGAPGPVAIFVRAPSDSDPAIPTRLEPHAEAYLALKKQVQPQNNGLSPARCRVQLGLEANGVPLTAIVSECPHQYFPIVGDAVMQWRWHPPRLAEGAATRAKTEVGVSFASRPR